MHRLLTIAPLARHALLMMVSLGVLLASGQTVSAGNVSGTVVLPERSLLGKPEVRSSGFVERFSNPLRPAQSYDPTPEMVVVLDGDVPPEAKSAPKRPIKLAIIGESFSSRLLPVVAGSTVAISNKGRGKPRLYSPTDPKIFSDSSPITGEREVKIDPALRPVEIRDHESVHLETTIVGFPHGFFSSIDAGGKFDIPDVPPGNWRVRVWYRDGWLEMTEPSVEVSKRGATAKIVIPPGLSRKKPN